MAFNAKNLHYEKQEPAFLRKLRGEHGGDRHNVQFARPKKDRLKTADEDDAPTIVDESGEVVGQAEYDAMVDGKDPSQGITPAELKVEDEQAVEESRRQDQPEKRKVAEIGGPKKRKAIKVVGEDVEDTQLVEDGVHNRGARDSQTGKVKAGKTKSGNKGRKVKLSFDEPQE